MRAAGAHGAGGARDAARFIVAAGRARKGIADALALTSLAIISRASARLYRSARRDGLALATSLVKPTVGKVVDADNLIGNQGLSWIKIVIGAGSTLTRPGCHF